MSHLKVVGAIIFAVSVLFIFGGFFICGIGNASCLANALLALIKLPIGGLLFGANLISMGGIFGFIGLIVTIIWIYSNKS